MKHACQYAIVHFMPFVETGEFANVGVVLLCPEARFFGFKLLKRYGRVTQFFEQLERRVFLEAKQGFQEELTRIHGLLEARFFDGQRTGIDTEGAHRIFAELTRTREVMFRFEAPRVALTDNPKETLAQLYDFYVDHNFVTKEYQERLLEGTVRRLLVTRNLVGRYQGAKVGDDDFHVRFPFVHMENERPAKVIKPFHLAQDEPNKILTHGGPWVDKVRRLKKRGTLPNRVLFAVQGPGQNQEKRFHAYEEICGDLREAGVEVVPITEQVKIVEFAQA